MNNFLYLFFVLFFSCSVKQKITWDKIKPGSVRHIGAESLKVNIDNATYSFTLTVFSGPSSKKYGLLISSIWKIDNDGIFLIKLGNNEVIKLIADNVNIGKIDYPAYIPILGSTSNSGLLTTEKVDYYSSIYNLDQESLTKIKEYGIYKIRIQFIDNYKEKSWKKDLLGNYIKKSYVLLENELLKPFQKSNSIEKGF